MTKNDMIQCLFRTTNPDELVELLETVKNMYADQMNDPDHRMKFERVSMHGLQQKTGSWMDDFIAAIKDPRFSFDSYLADYRETVEVIDSL